MKKLLITGATGQVGRCLLDRIEQNQWQLFTPSSSELDITSCNDVVDFFSQYEPNVVINAAAYTAVDKAESEIESATSINETGAENLARACSLLDAPIIHLSTDYVFSGESDSPYNEQDATNPLNIYGSTKLAGEKQVAELANKHIIVRTAWVFSEYGSNFLKTILRLAKDKKEIGVVYDQIGSPTYAGDVASAVLKLSSLALKGDAEGLWGIYHFSGDVAVSWFEFARQIFKCAEEKKFLNAAPLVKRIPTSAYPTAAKRPPFSILDCGKVARHNIEPSNWMDALKTIDFG